MQTRKSKVDVGKPKRPVAEHPVEQCGALCFRVNGTGGIEVLLVTSRDNRRWVIPKGNMEKHEAQFRCAQREAREEAGVVGKVGKTPLGRYVYRKDNARPSVAVAVFPLRVETELDEFREVRLRERRWIAVEAAAELVAEPELREILQQICTDEMPKMLRKAVERLTHEDAA